MGPAWHNADNNPARKSPQPQALCCPVTDTVLDKSKGARGTAQAEPEPREPVQPAQTDAQEQFRGHQWTSSLPQVASEDIIDIGNGRYAHFRRDRRFAQVQVAFTAPKDIDPNPGRELTEQFKELGWTWRPKEPGKPWTYQLEKSSPDDPTARGDSRDALHEQFRIIIQEYREKRGMPPTLGWRSLAESDAKARNAESSRLSSSPVDDQAAKTSEKHKPKSANAEARAGGEGGPTRARRCSTPSPPWARSGLT